MIKKLTKISLLAIIIQILSKQKYIFKLNLYTNKKKINLLEFLWLNKYIFGFSLQPEITITNKTLITIYLKPTKFNNNLSYVKLNYFQNKKYIQKLQKWSKNSFFIVITIKGILNGQKFSNYKIGGFLLCRLN